MNLETLGWSRHFEAAFEPFRSAALVPARVAREDRESYVVYAAGRAMRAGVTGAFRYRAVIRSDYPAVGDWVATEPRDGENAASIHAILPRRSAIERKAAGDVETAQLMAANVDTLLICGGLDRDFNLRRIERYLALAQTCRVAPVILLTKADVCEEVDSRVAVVRAAAGDAPVIVASVIDGRGIAELRARVPSGATATLLGSSGVGKSSLINALLGSAAMPVGGVRESDGRGRHTTTHRQLLLLPGGGVIIDTPGMRELGLWGEADGVDAVFADIDALAHECRFRDCRHESEPGCAVLAAEESGELDTSRLASYRKLVREIGHLERREDPEAARAELQRWKAIHKSARKWMKQKYRS